MYSLLPVFSGFLFLLFGFYVANIKGFNRLSTSFIVLCVTTFFWQFTWAVLFQIKDPEAAVFLVKIGYLFIIFLPTSLYHFLTEITEKKSERIYVYFSYSIAVLLAATLVFTDLFVSGYYEYFFGYYPKAGIAHPLHVLQTIIVVNRGLWITYIEQKQASDNDRIKLQVCIASVLIYFFAAVDYVCNYGVEMYPFGVIFILISLGLFALATIKYHMMDKTLALAASVTHEIRTPLLSIRLQARAISEYWKELHFGYQLAVKNGLIASKIPLETTNEIEKLTKNIEFEVNRSNNVIDMFLASSSERFSDKKNYETFNIEQCVLDAIEKYPFDAKQRKNIQYSCEENYTVFGSRSLLIFVLFNLIKNSLRAINNADKGGISIVTTKDYRLVFSDTGTGIAEEVLPYIFDEFYSTNHHASGTGVGLPFCRRVMSTFKGNINCQSIHGESTTFTLTFPTREPNTIG